MARSTCDGSSVPDEQADPVETATPSRSSAMSSDSASTASKLMFVVFGTRGSRAPLMAVPGTRARIASSSPFRRAESRAASADSFATASRAASPEAGDARHVLGAGAAAPFVLAAGHRGGHAGAALDPERSRSLWTVELVRRERQQVDAQRPDVDGNFPDGLHRIGMEHGAARVRDPGQLRDWLDGTDFVIGVHHGDQRRVVGQRARQRSRVDDARCTNRQERRRASPGARAP